MIRTTRIAKNSFFLFISQGYIALTVFLYIPLLTRYLGQEGYGRYNYAYAFIGIFQVLASLGLHQILVREVARDKERAGLYLGNSLVIKLLLSAITLGVIALAVALRGPRPADILIMSLATGEMLLRIYGNVNLSIFRAFQRMEYELLVDFVDGTIGLVGVVMAVYFQLGLVAVFLAFFLAAVARTLTSFLIGLILFAKPQFQMDKAIWKHFLGESTPIGVSMGLQRGYERQGTVILEGMRGSAEVGLLGGPLRIYRLMDIVTQSVVGALFPMFSSLAVSKKQALVEAYQTAFKLLALLSLPLAGFLLIFAEQITSLLLGPDFVAATDLLRLLAPAIIFSFLGFLFSFLLRAIDRQRVDTMNWGLALLLNFALSYLLIAPLGFMGAGFALFISEAIFCLAGYLLVSRYLPRISLKESLVKPLACGIIAGATLFFLRQISFPVAFLASGLAYLAAISLLNVLNHQEREMLNGLAEALASRLGWRKTSGV